MNPPYISFSGEDQLSEALARRCVAYSLPDTQFYSMRPMQGGNDAVKSKFRGYMDSAVAFHFFVMIDLDMTVCPPALREKLLLSAGAKAIPDKMLLSIVKREAEAWVLGDRSRLAGFLGVNVNKFPDQPEELEDPKAILVRIARYSNTYKQDLCPRAGTTAKVGVGYNDILSDFVQNHWRPDVAAQSCETLRRTLDRLQNMNRES